MKQGDACDASAPRRAGTLQRLGWFIGLWLAGVGAVGAVAALLRLWIA